jgi:hypothetical protein
MTADEILAQIKEKDVRYVTSASPTCAASCSMSPSTSTWWTRSS